jgi:hypothetical protein
MVFYLKKPWHLKIISNFKLIFNIKGAINYCIKELQQKKIHVWDRMIVFSNLRCLQVNTQLTMGSSSNNNINKIVCFTQFLKKKAKCNINIKCFSWSGYFQVSWNRLYKWQVKPCIRTSNPKSWRKIQIATSIHDCFLNVEQKINKVQ